MSESTRSDDQHDPVDVAPGQDAPTLEGTAPADPRGAGEETWGGAAIVRGNLPRWAPLLTGAVALGVSALVTGAAGWGIAMFMVVAWLVLLVAYPGWSLAVEGRRHAADRLVSTLMWTAFALAMIPLVSLLVTVVVKGAPVLDLQFLTDDMGGTARIGGPGGIYHAIMGTLMVTGMATVMAVPVGILTAIWLVEYGQGTRLAKVVTFLVDVMTGIPSIVAGLFAVALFIVITQEPLPQLGIGGAVALALLMLPTVIRAVEEMLKLVPDDLREASYALGVSRWRTIAKVVLPTSVAGIVTGVTLSIARVAGETAPLLLILGTNITTNWNPFSGPVQTLPVFIYQSTSQMAGRGAEVWTDRVWGAAFVLILIVMSLNVLARVIGRVFSPRTGT